MISNDEAGRRYRARAAAQVAARKRLIEQYKAEYNELYRQECIRIFEERDLGIPEFRDA